VRSLDAVTDLSADALLSYATAMVLLSKADAARANSYRRVVLRDRPVAYWPLSDELGALYALNLCGRDAPAGEGNNSKEGGEEDNEQKEHGEEDNEQDYHRNNNDEEDGGGGGGGAERERKHGGEDSAAWLRSRRRRNHTGGNRGGDDNDGGDDRGRFSRAIRYRVPGCVLSDAGPQGPKVRSVCGAGWWWWWGGGGRRWW
jgi:hypothetical protein